MSAKARVERPSLRRRSARVREARKIAFCYEDNVKILQLEKEVLRLRGVIDQHEKEAETRYRGRAEAAEREARYAEARAVREKAARDDVDRQVAAVLEPLKPLFLLMSRLWPEDER